MANQGSPRGSDNDRQLRRERAGASRAVRASLSNTGIRSCATRRGSRDPADAEDAAIRVMTESVPHARYHRSRQEAPPRAWLFTIARNEVINTYRLQTRTTPTASRTRSS